MKCELNPGFNKISVRVLDTLNFVTFNLLANNNPIALRRRKLIAKIDGQIPLAANSDYTPTKHKWITDSEGNQKKLKLPSVLSGGGQQVLTERLTLLCIMKASH